MKKLIPIFLLLFSTTVFSETYTCSTNLSPLGQSGVETTIYKRDGKKFIGTSKYNKNYPVQILHENSNDIILYELDQNLDNTSILITLISKKYLKYTQDFMISTVVSKDKVIKLLGECLVN
jgi:hypothetical protein